MLQENENVARELMGITEDLVRSGDQAAPEAQQKVGDLNQNWTIFKQRVESRIRIAQIFVEFHQQAVHLASEMDSLEDIIKNTMDQVDFLPEATIQLVEDRWRKVQQQYTQLKQLADTFLVESSQVCSLVSISLKEIDFEEVLYDE